MKGFGSNKESDSNPELPADNPAARAAAFLTARESPEYQPSSCRRDPEAARASADAIMAQVQAIGAPDLLVNDEIPARMPFRIARYASRFTGLAVAAVLVAAVSSVITFNLIRSSATVDVRFVLEAPKATSVWLAADFNEWSPDGYRLEKSADGTWEITVPLRKGKAYAYNFIIDGEHWVADPSAPAHLDDGFGGSSSSLSL